MREEITEVKKYICDICGREHYTEEEAKECEGEHYIYDEGDVVYFDDGTYGYEQGQRDPSWRSDYVQGVVIDIKPDYCLVETSAGERNWKRCKGLRSRNPNEEGRE